MVENGMLVHCHSQAALKGRSLTGKPAEVRETAAGLLES